MSSHIRNWIYILIAEEQLHAFVCARDSQVDRAESILTSLIQYKILCVLTRTHGWRYFLSDEDPCCLTQNMIKFCFQMIPSFQWPMLVAYTNFSEIHWKLEKLARTPATPGPPCRSCVPSTVGSHGPENKIYIYKILMGYIIYWICKHIYIYQTKIIYAHLQWGFINIKNNHQRGICQE